MNTQEKAPAIYAAMAGIISELEAVKKGKEGSNGSQRFKYRGIDDAYNALHPLLAKYKVATVPSVQDIIVVDNLTTLKVEYHFVSLEDGSEIVATSVGQGRGGDDKSSNKAMSGAHKAAIYQTFCIPTEDLDDADAADAASGKAAKPTAVKPAPKGDEVKDIVRRITEIMGRHAISKEQFTALTGLETMREKTADELRKAEDVLTAFITGFNAEAA